MEISAEERVMDLILALANTRTRMTKQQIRSQVRGYSAHGDDRAFERMFERDKDLLRQLGIPLVVAHGAFDDDVGYRIDLTAYQLDLELTAEEIGLLSLARQVLEASEWRTPATRGVTKVRGLGPAAELAAPQATFELAVAGDQLDTLLQAAAAHRAVSFPYQPLQGESATRHVLPWQVVVQHRAWYLVGFDEDRGAQRAFKLSRIVGEIAVGEQREYSVPAQYTVQSAQPVDITVAVRPGRAWELRRRTVTAGTMTNAAGEERDLLQLTAPADSRLVEELAGYGADCVVLSPDTLRAEVTARLRAAREVADA